MKNTGRLTVFAPLAALAALVLPAHADVKKVWMGVKGVHCAT
jgi:hypothetical protein